MKGIISSFERLARDNGLEMVFRGKEESIMFYYDAERMEDILVNLLSNAVKFTPRGGKVTVSVHCLLKKEVDFPCGSLHICAGVDAGFD